MLNMYSTKEGKLLHWCMHKRIFSSVDARRYGLDNFYTTADRTVRRFVEEGKLRRIPNAEAVLKGLIGKGCKKIAWYEFLQLEDINKMVQERPNC